MIDANKIVGSHDIVFITLDTLRYDVAVELLRCGRTPNLKAVLPPEGWEARHSPGNFTYAAHAAFFAGFLPTPAAPSERNAPKAERLFAIRFPGSETTSAKTRVFDAPDIVQGFHACGYHTVCIGGTGFFNPASPLGRVLPGLFAENFWSQELGVTDPRSTENQVALALDVLARNAGRRLFLFINVSAIHQPNCIYLPGAKSDSLDSHAAALAYVDAQLKTLFDALRRRGPAFVIVCSDHGTAYGEDGYWGHRLSHPVVWTVPYAEFFIQPENEP